MALFLFICVILTPSAVTKSDVLWHSGTQQYFLLKTFLNHCNHTMSYQYEEGLDPGALARYKTNVNVAGLELCPYKIILDKWINDPKQCTSDTSSHRRHFYLKHY